MNEVIQRIINETTSPLFRIMAAYDIDNPIKRRFENNISAFHVGNGYFLSVSHSLIFHNNFVRSVREDIFNDQILKNCSLQDQAFLNTVYSVDRTTNKRYWNDNPSTVQQLINLFTNHKIDFRYPKLYENDICSPYLVIQFREDNFFGNEENKKYFDSTTRFFEDNIIRYTYLVKLKLVKIFVDSDISLYQLDDKYSELASFIPSVKIDSSLLTIADESIFCLQGAPVNELGRMLNKASIDGVLDHFSPQAFIRNEHNIFSGLRYLIKGFFRFGSSGAPYLIYKADEKSFYANAIQSEACPLQMIINNNREGNAQFVSAIATPLYNIRDDISRLGI